MWEKFFSIAKPVSGLGVLMIVLAACTPAPVSRAINDPFETSNRKVHALNKALDKSLVRPVAKAYGNITPRPVANGIDNFAANLSLPAAVLNDVLQLKIADALQNTARFAFNSTVGLAGVFDVASMNGLNEKSTDFGETLYVWGVPEGAYIELPLLGGSTERAAAGIAVDFVINPTKSMLHKSQRKTDTSANILKKIDDRNKYSAMINSVLYGSDDSYAQTRLIYLQSRRNQLQGGLNDADLEDPYAQ